MGSTVTTDKLIGAIQAPSGIIMYALFEETYEKNCYPHTPDWSCVSFGPISTALERIFSSASYLEGGLLQTRRGHGRPEPYIKDWLDKLKSPVALVDNQILLWHRAGSFSSPISEENEAAVYQVLAAHGQHDVAAKLRLGEEVLLSLSRDTELVAALHVDGHISAWKLFPHTPIHGMRDGQLGYHPTRVRPSVIKVPKLLKFHDGSLLMQEEDGAWHASDRIDIIASFVRARGLAELQEPGGYLPRLTALRAAIEAAPQMPAGVTVKIDLTVELEHAYQNDHVMWVIRQVPLLHSEATHCIAAVPHDPNLLWGLKRLPRETVTWCVPDQAVAAHGDQLALLVA